jgi:heptaprenyl diphosphate synthase
MPISLPKQLRKVTDKALIKTLETGLEQVESALLEATSHTDPIAKVTARHLAAAGGKRMRPTLVLLAAQLGDANNQQVIDAAVVVELTHLATLYHDDVMDNAPLRRGVATAHEIWGNSVAILTGDLLFARASQVVSKLGAKALTLQADTFERLCLGQLHETVGPNETEDAVAHYIQVMADKTGSLIAASAELGIMFSGAPDEYREPMRQYGENIGVAFQLIDDVIDIHSDGSKSGKTPGTDLLAGVPTLPVLLLRQSAKINPADQALVDLIDAGLDQETLKTVIAALRKHPVTEAANQEARRWAQAAVDSISSLPDGSVKTALETFALAVVDREQ